MASRLKPSFLHATAAGRPRRTTTRTLGSRANRSRVASRASSRSDARVARIFVPSPMYQGTTFQVTTSRRRSRPASRRSCHMFCAVWSSLSGETNPDPASRAERRPGASSRSRIRASVPASVGSKYRTAASGLDSRRRSTNRVKGATCRSPKLRARAFDRSRRGRGSSAACLSSVGLAPARLHCRHRPDGAVPSLEPEKPGDRI